MNADHLKRSSDGYTAELLIETVANGVPGGVLALERHNLVASASHARLANELVKLYEADWRSMILEFCISILAAERQGLVFERFSEMPEGGPQTYLIDPILAEGEVNLIYAPGDSGKSTLLKLLALAVHGQFPSLCEMHVQGGPASYLDWEANRKTFQGDIAGLAMGFGIPGPDIHYARVQRPLAEHAEQVARHVTKEGLRLLIIDSFEMASGSGSERESYQDRALRMLEAVRLFGDTVTTVLIDHVSKDTQKSSRPGTATPFGSAFKMNEVRWAWELRSAMEPETGALKMALYNTKHNHARQHAPIGLRIEFRPDGATLVMRDDAIPKSLTSPGKPAGKPTNGKLIYEALEWAMKPLGPKAIALATGLSEEICTSELRRLDGKKFRKAEDGGAGRGKITLWEHIPEDVPF